MRSGWEGLPSQHLLVVQHRLSVPSQKQEAGGPEDRQVGGKANERYGFC